MPELAPLNATLQESTLALLAHSDEHGRIVAQLVTPNVFTGDYKAVAEACLRYWKTQNRAPGAHLDDELAHLLDDKTSRRAQTFRQIIHAMGKLSEAMNTGYVLGRVQSFVRMQNLKDAMVRAADVLNKPGGDLQLEQVEASFAEIISHSKDRVSFDPGMRLTESDRVVDSLEAQDEFAFGIRQLDNAYIVPQRGTVTLLLAGAKKGKSWFLVNTGRVNLKRRKKVLHISLEMGEPEVGMRYYQNMFKITKRRMEDTKGRAVPERIRTFDIEQDDEDSVAELVDFGFQDTHPAFTLDAPMVRQELSTRLTHYSGLYDDLLIKRWAPRALDENVLTAYLDRLEVVDKFVPDLLILDYMGLWKTVADNHRITLGRAFEEFRGICVKRNLAGVTAHQVSKAGDIANRSTAHNVAEDWSLIATADQVLVFSSTEWEFNYGLGRLYVDRARNERDKFGLLLSQSYGLGQFCVDSMHLPSNYQELVEEKSGGKAHHDDDTGMDEEDGGFVRGD